MDNNSKNVLRTPYWVGKFANEAIVVYDPAIQLSGVDYVYLYDLRSGRLNQYPSDATRLLLKKVTNPGAISAASMAYDQWKVKFGAQIHNPSSYTLTVQFTRSPNCYNCNKSLDNSSNSKCSSCGWLKCDHCNSCGCNFNDYN